MSVPSACCYIICIRFTWLVCVGRAPYDAWPFACVVTLYAFVSLACFVSGERHMIWPFACVVTLYAFVLLVVCRTSSVNDDPFACVVTLHLFRLLLAVGQRHMILCHLVVTLYAFVSDGLLNLGLAVSKCSIVVFTNTCTSISIFHIFGVLLNCGLGP